MRGALKYRKFFTSTVFLSFATGTILNERIFYTFSGSIDLPEDTEMADPGITTYHVTSIMVNGTSREIPAAYITKEKNRLHHTFSLELHHENEYELFIKREKILSKKRNPDKRAFAPYIIKDAKISVIVNIGMDVDFHKMGTINEFEKSAEHINNDVKILSWNYKGLILPEQGFIIILK